MTDQHRVFVVDRSVLFRRILDEILTGENETLLVGVNSTLRESQRDIRKMRPDTLVVSIVESEQDLPKILAGLRKDMPHLSIIGLCDPALSPPGQGESPNRLDFDVHVAKPPKTAAMT